MDHLFAFPKSEKLCGKLRIAHLYSSGKRFVCFPLRVSYLIEEGAPSEAPRVLIWAPKRCFKHATDRNALRRKMREAYRLQAQPLKQLCAELNINLQVAFVYINTEQADYALVGKAMKKSINELVKRLHALSPTNPQA